MGRTVPGGRVSLVSEPVRNVRPVTLRAAILLLWLKALALAAIAAWLAYADITGKAQTQRLANLVTAYAVVFALLCGLLGWALWRRRGWARGPAVVIELFVAFLGWYMITGGLAWAGAGVIALGVIAVVLLLTPSTREALGIR